MVISIQMLCIMNKRASDVNEIIVLIAMLGILALMTIQFFSPEALDFSFLKSRLGTFLSGCVLCYLAFREFRSARSKVDWTPNRFAGIIRAPLYFAATIFLFYLTATGGANA